MSDPLDWRQVYDFWYPSGLAASVEAHLQAFRWWFGGGSNAELPRFRRHASKARGGQLNYWSESPLGRLALIIVLDQFPRGLFPYGPEAYASDGAALALAEEGLSNGHYAALAHPWEKTSYLVAMGHAEGPGHLGRFDRIVDLADMVATKAPTHLEPLYRHSASQARAHREVIARFGRYPHRNSALGRASTAEERAYLDAGDLVHRRPLPVAPAR